MKVRLLTTIITLTVAGHLTAQYQDGNTRAWGSIEYKDDPWVYRVSRPNNITEGLLNRHIALWASHGRYYDADKGKWVWQRPNLFGTTEDLFTQTIVVPYLIPMLENAGATVFTPRERDWQTHEVIVDNDDRQKAPYYIEFVDRKSGKQQILPALPFTPGHIMMVKIPSKTVLHEKPKPVRRNIPVRCLTNPICQRQDDMLSM